MGIRDVLFGNNGCINCPKRVASTADPVARIANPRKRELAQMIVDGATEEAMVAAGFPVLRIKEMRAYLKKMYV